MKTAFLIDGGFFLKRYEKIENCNREDDPEIVAMNLIKYVYQHLTRINDYRKRFNLPPTELHRIYYYDARPFEGDTHHPITNRAYSFKRTDQFKHRTKLFQILSKQRKVALRLGFLKNSSKHWVIKSHLTKKLINGTMEISDLTESDVAYPLTQKAVDMKLGLDIATLAY
jgi:uncharacterized LabA/DUF88 family protein